MPKIMQRLSTTLKHLDKYRKSVVCTISDIKYQECGYKTSNEFPTDNWHDLEFLTGKDKHYWIRFAFSTPEADDDFTYMLSVNTGITGWDVLNPQGIIYLNGEMTQGLDINHTEVFLEGGKNYEAYIYFYSSNAGHPIKPSIDLLKYHKETEALYFDMLVPFETADGVYNPNTQEFADTISVLEQTANLLDLRQPYSKEFYESVKDAREFMGRKFYEKLCSTDGKPTVHCIGHTHLDVEWLWARNQTREKIQRSFSNINALMEKYPESKFTLTQPELYRYLKEDAPEKYAQLKALVKEGRWEPEGAMYVEADCNLTSGESLIRQILYGKRFFLDEFGVDCKILFLPDVFGYSAALPQILNKSGIRHFLTSKISWNDTNKMPYDSFMWQGIDGSEIFATFTTACLAQKDRKTETKTNYVGKIDSKHIVGAWDRYQQKEYNRNVLLTYGFGDGGGGPARWMYEKFRRLEKGLPNVPVAKMNFLLPYLDDARKEFDENSAKLHRMPRWVGELYLELHRGTYTSIAKNKRNNRFAEMGLQKAEALSAIDLFFGGCYDKQSFDSMWTKVLHNQFHDILPGSSIGEVYDGTDKDYARIEEALNTICSDKLKKIKNNLSTAGGVFVYNTSGFARCGNVKLQGKTVELKTPASAYGWSVVEVHKENKVAIKNNLLENDFYRVAFDKAGRITSIYDKTANREVVPYNQRFNELQAYEDIPYTYDAWDICDYYKSKKYVLDDDAEIEPIIDGTRSGFIIKKRYMDSQISQKVWLYSQKEGIDFETEIDWHQNHQVLKIAFPIDVNASEAKYETQFGYVTRPTHENTSWDAAKFEVCAHKWVDISECGYGVSVLNDCKYGYSAEGTTIKLTALKCATYPYPEADFGKHVFSYSIIPHKGDIKDNNIVQKAYSFNQPLYADVIGKQRGTLPEQFSFVNADNDSVIIDTVKKAENSDGIIIRLYEAYNSRENVTLSFADGFNEVYLCDMMENELEKLVLQNNTVTLKVKNFEIITLKLKK